MGQGSRAGRGALQALIMATLAFAWSFVVWGLISPLATELRTRFGLTNLQVSILLAAPVLVGSLGRIPVGRLTDRHGGRVVFSLLLAFLALPLVWLGMAGSYGGLLAGALLLGAGGSAFAIGTPFVSRWFPADRQGLALGVYGLGNAGLAVAALAVPLLAAAGGVRWVFWALIPITLAAAAAFWLLGRDAPAGQAGVAGSRRHPKDARVVLLSFWYFLSFGGMVAFSAYLPKLYGEVFGLSAPVAGMLAGVFVLVATVTRPLGGWLADRWGGLPVLYAAFAGMVLGALALTVGPGLAWFRVATFVLGTAMGAANGAVFKLVPFYFPGATGAVAGTVGAVGGLGGFFPPLLLGLVRELAGTYAPGFALLAAANAVALWTVHRSLGPSLQPRHAGAKTAASAIGVRSGRPQDAVVGQAGQVHRLPAGARLSAEAFASRAARNAFLTVLAMGAAIYYGSARLLYFDPYLYGYAIAAVVAAAGIAMRLTAWLMRPAARLYWQRTLPLLLSGRWPVERAGAAPGAQALAGAPPAERPKPWRAALHTFVDNILLQRFIFRRSSWRGIQHQLLFWGVLLSFAFTIPLTFGWMRLETITQTHYRAILMGLPSFTFPVAGVRAWLVFHFLDIAAFITLGGVSMALWRRLRDKDARVDQRVAYDLFPLWLLLTVTVTGLFMTASKALAEGAGYPAFAVVHQWTVIVFLLYLPFGKFFHIPMRSASVAVEVYRQGAALLGEQRCLRCGNAYAPRLQVQDVVAALAESGLSFKAPDGRTDLSEYCLECKRVLRALLYTRRPLRPEERGAGPPAAKPIQGLAKDLKGDG